MLPLTQPWTSAVGDQLYQTPVVAMPLVVAEPRQKEHHVGGALDG